MLQLLSGLVYHDSWDERESILIIGRVCMTCILQQGVGELIGLLHHATLGPVGNTIQLVIDEELQMADRRVANYIVF